MSKSLKIVDGLSFKTALAPITVSAIFLLLTYSSISSRSAIKSLIILAIFLLNLCAAGG